MNAKKSIDAGGKDGRAAVAERTLEQAQLAYLAARLKHVSTERDTIAALGGNPKTYAADLAARYKALAAKLQDPVQIKASALPPGLAAALNNISNLFGWWQNLTLPRATGGIIQVPHSSHTSGAIDADIFQSNLALGGTVSNSDTQDQWWVSSWNYTAEFPRTPTGAQNAGSLAYRFAASASLSFYRQDVMSGSIYVIVTVATTPDIATKPINFSTYASSTFLIDVSLPISAIPPITGGGSTISGTISLVPGGTPAIGINIGVIAAVSAGTVQIIPGEFSNIEIAPPGATSTSDLGKIQYRHDPIFWVEAIQQKLA